MDIQKCKVEKNCEWSAAVVKGLAVTLGMSALVSLEGCASNVAKTSNDLTESVQPSSSSELSSSSMSDSSNDSDNETQMIEKILKKLDSDPFNELSEEEMEELKKYIESHREEPSGGVMEND